MVPPWALETSTPSTARSPTLSVTQSTHNNRNQITSDQPGGWMRVRGTTDEPATVRVRSNANLLSPSMPECGDGHGVELCSKRDDIMARVEYPSADKVIAADFLKSFEPFEISMIDTACRLHLNPCKGAVGTLQNKINLLAVTRAEVQEARPNLRDGKQIE